MVIATCKKFTIAEYHQLVDLGFFTENDKIELIRGEIINKFPKKPPHSACNSLLISELEHYTIKLILEFKSQLHYPHIVNPNQMLSLRS